MKDDTEFVSWKALVLWYMRVLMVKRWKNLGPIWQLAATCQTEKFPQITRTTLEVDFGETYWSDSVIVTSFFPIIRIKKTHDLWIVEKKYIKWVFCMKNKVNDAMVKFNV